MMAAQPIQSHLHSIVLALLVGKSSLQIFRGLQLLKGEVMVIKVMRKRNPWGPFKVMYRKEAVFCPEDRYYVSALSSDLLTAVFYMGNSRIEVFGALCFSSGKLTLG